jgi:hypothetical protein
VCHAALRRDARGPDDQAPTHALNAAWSGSGVVVQAPVAGRFNTARRRRVFGGGDGTVGARAGSLGRTGGPECGGDAGRGCRDAAAILGILGGEGGAWLSSASVSATAPLPLRVCRDQGEEYNESGLHQL